MRFRTGFALAAVVLGVMVVPACSDKQTMNPDLTAGSGAVSVYVTDATGNVASANVKLSALSIYTSAGTKVTLIASGSAAQTIDLVAAHSNPAFLGQFTIPAGDYNGVDGTIEGVDFTMENGDRCTFMMGPVTMPKMTFGSTIIHVDDQNHAKLTIDIPIISGTCPGNGMQGTLSFGSASCAAAHM